MKDKAGFSKRNGDQSEEERQVFFLVAKSINHCYTHLNMFLDGFGLNIFNTFIGPAFSRDFSSCNS